jgi:hypothetical protein
VVKTTMVKTTMRTMKTTNKLLRMSTCVFV